MQPIFAAIEPIASYCEACSLPCSSTSRTARSRTSDENLFDVFRFSIAPSYPRSGASGIPGAVQYHHAKLVQAWLAQPGRRIKLHFIPAYCPHLDSIERLSGLMHQHITHNRCHATCADFRNAIVTFLHEEVPRKRPVYCDEVSDNFRVISPKNFRILA